MSPHRGGGGLPRLRPALHASAGHQVATLASYLRPCRGSFSTSLSSGPQAAGRVLVSLSPPAARQVQDEKAVAYEDIGHVPQSCSPRTRSVPGMRGLGSGDTSKHLEYVLCVWLGPRSLTNMNSVITTKRNRCHYYFYPALQTMQRVSGACSRAQSY